ncbi:MAG TPA: sodium:proton antiporter [Candidatus Krumholzibacteria bacterium]|nr:sodium:proton antiporter [Candidatus Krumholzibacteria bacterium]
MTSTFLPRRLGGWTPALLVLAGLLLFPVLGAQAQDHGHDHAADTHAAESHAADAHGAVTDHDGHGDDHGPALGARLPLWSAIPFVGILLSIAVFPLVAPHFWHHHFPKVSAAWAVLFAVPFLIAFKTEAVQAILHIYLIDYIPFIILLWALFTVSGGIYVGGSLRGSPKVNLTLLVIGTLLASWIGTTGAAMVLIRPLLRANAWRRNKVHVVIFFIFLVANIGGSLTPLGDPPLFLGFLHGVPFFWVTTGILMEMLMVSALLLLAFFVIDTLAFRKEEPAPDDGVKEPIKIEGLHNLIFLLGIMAGVLFSGSVKLSHVPIYGHVFVELQNWVRDGFLILMGVLSLRTTAKIIREKNEFSWFPIQEVAYLFAGIFMTIIPALAILQVGKAGALAGLVEFVKTPVHYFWVTGGLSSFLDNAPTYLTFFNTALGSFGMPESAVPGMLGYADPSLINHHFIEDLKAISSGAVFMGAMTYIGNAPNFMVKSIAEEAGIPMPSFFGYMLKYSLPILVPVFVIATLVFFV